MHRCPEKFVSDDQRVITRLFLPGGEARIRAVVDRVLQLREDEVAAILGRILRSFASRHADVGASFQRHFDEAKPHFDREVEISDERALLVGAYFTMEYSIESAALFNPSIVPHPDQSGLPPGAVRFLMSLRATGEGHVSSIVFRSGVIDASGEIRFDPAARYTRRMRVVETELYDKHSFYLKIIEMGAYNDCAQAILAELPDPFTYTQLNTAVDHQHEELGNRGEFQETAGSVLWLARSNYHLKLPEDADPSDVVVFPATENDSNGIEDTRLVRFVDDDGTVIYYGTYTAYNGFRILPQILETTDFTTIKISTLNGRFVRDKGMALFPRKVDDWYLMISRLDGECLYLMQSDNVRFWNEAEKLQSPTYPWEFVQIGNCGPPLETEAGWLLLTHGVGPMRQYCIGVSLLDLNNPQRVIGQLEDPLLAPTEEERHGYVPNVVYSCGSMIHNDRLIIPYGLSDSATSFATASVTELLEHLVP